MTFQRRFETGKSVSHAVIWRKKILSRRHSKGRALDGVFQGTARRPLWLEWGWERKLLETSQEQGQEPEKCLDRHPDAFGFLSEMRIHWAAEWYILFSQVYSGAWSAKALQESIGELLSNRGERRSLGLRWEVEVVSKCYDSRDFFIRKSQKNLLVVWICIVKEQNVKDVFRFLV